MGVLEKYDTSDVHPSQRQRYWNEVSERRYSGSLVDLHGDDFAGAMWSWTVDELALLRPRTGPCRVTRNCSIVAEERVILHLQCRGTGRYAQGDRDVILVPGDLLLLSTSRAYSIDLSRHETLAVECSRKIIEDRVPDLEQKLGQLISGTSPSVRILYQFLLSLWNQGMVQEHHPDWERDACGLCVEMLTSALRSSQYADEWRGSTSQSMRVKALVDAMLQDPDLNSSQLASACDVSVRTIQMIFAGMGTNPTAYISNRRLERAAERLLVQPEMSITELAYDSGFNDSSYFARAFRRRFGVGPREWRSRN